MSLQVYYLSFYYPELGLLFPDELPDQYYAPGLFIVEEEKIGALATSYAFDAMDNGQRVTLLLTRQGESGQFSNLYVVKTTSYGSFWFSLEDVNQGLVTYKGRRSQLRKHNKLRVVVARDSHKLERICKKHNFYFIGSTLRDN